MEGYDFTYLTGWEGFQAAIYTSMSILALCWGLVSAIRESRTQHIIVYEDQREDDPINDDDWNIICRQAIEKAKSGDGKARDWVMKNIMQSRLEEQETAAFLTGSQVVEDAIATLVSMGHQQSEAKQLVTDLARDKEYVKVEDLLQDIYRRTNK